MSEVDVLRTILAGTSGEGGSRFFAQLVQNLARILRTRGLWVTEYLETTRRLRALAFWFNGEWVMDYEYDVAGTPCESVVDNRRLIHIPERVVELYPLDLDLKADGAVSYLGVPLLAPDGRVLGHLAALDDKPMPEDAGLLAIFQIFAERASTELRRQQIEAALGERETKVQALLSETKYLREELERLHGPSTIIGDSESLSHTRHEIEQAAGTDVTVLVLGETGTGKELVARAIQAGSRRCDRPFVQVNCGALPDTLIESELFGHEKGAFTGATQRRDGRFALADGGTIFLDEIGDLPLPLQVKFLRVLQEGEFSPVGSSQTRKVDVRVIAATNRDLSKAVEMGTFRGDLYFRLNVFPIVVPPLRERGDDVIALAEAFACRCAAQMGRPIEPLSHSAIAALKRHAWPGNVRELQNVMERAVIASRDGRLDLGRLLPEADGSPVESPRTGIADSDGPAPADRVFTDTEMKDLERSNILRALEAADWRVAGNGAAASLLQVSPSTLASRMKALGIRRPARS